jgi:hypothetical protein
MRRLQRHAARHGCCHTPQRGRREGHFCLAKSARARSFEHREGCEPRKLSPPPLPARSAAWQRAAPVLRPRYTVPRSAGCTARSVEP